MLLGHTINARTPFTSTHGLAWKFVRKHRNLKRVKNDGCWMTNNPRKGGEGANVWHGDLGEMLPRLFMVRLLSRNKRGNFAAE